MVLSICWRKKISFVPPPLSLITLSPLTQQPKAKSMLSLQKVTHQLHVPSSVIFPSPLSRQLKGMALTVTFGKMDPPASCPNITCELITSSYEISFYDRLIMALLFICSYQNKNTCCRTSYDAIWTGQSKVYPTTFFENYALGQQIYSNSSKI